MVFQILYELKTPEKDYSPLFTYLETGMGESGIHVLRDCWWVSNPHQEDVVEMCKEVRNYLGENDVFYITVVSPEQINGWLSSGSWNWFREHKG